MSFAFGLPVINNPAGYVDVKGITNYSELSFAVAQSLHAQGVKVLEYPLFAYCSASQLEEDTPDCLPGATQVVSIDDEEVVVPVSLNQWLINQNYTTQELTNGKFGFELNCEKVSFEQALALNALVEFTVVDTPTYLGLLPDGEI
jgi:hypothetical protein